MTWPELELACQKASERLRRDALEHANLAAIGVQVGFSGDLKPLKTLQRELGLRSSGGSQGSSDVGRAVAKLVNDLGEAGAVRVKHGANRGPARGRTRGKHSAVP